MAPVLGFLCKVSWHFGTLLLQRSISDGHLEKGLIPVEKIGEHFLLSKQASPTVHLNILMHESSAHLVNNIRSS